MSTPSKGHIRPPIPPVSSITEESDCEGHEDFPVPGVQPLVTETEEGDVLESSMHSLSIAEENDSPDEGDANDLRNSFIEMDDCWVDPSHKDWKDEDSSDEDYFPFLQLRTGRVNTNNLAEISLDEAVLDVATPNPPELESQYIPEQERVLCEEDLVGKSANITYNNNLHQLAMYLMLPLQKCNYLDRVSGVACSGEPPFRVSLKPRGTGVILEWSCPFGHILWKWNSQPVLKYGMQGGDFMLATNTLLSGNNYRKIALLFQFMKMPMVAEGTFFRIQDAYCIDPVQECWEKNRAVIINRLCQEEHVVVLGDGRMDSPESRDIVHIVTVDKRETNRNSVIMEKECFIRTMDSLIQEIPVKEVVTDAHPQISALLDPKRGRYKNIHHSLDIWHAAKNLGKKLRRAGTMKNQNSILAWMKDIVNHFWYCCKQSLSEEQFKMMWHGVLHHVRNQHSWATGCCDHEPLDESSQNKPWIQEGSAAHQALTAIVLDKRWLSQVKKFINFRTTSDFESFQNHILMYAAKRFAYSPPVYRTRVLLAALDYNNHNHRQPARNKDGHKIYRRYFNKKSKSWSVYTTKEKKQYSYIQDLQKSIIGRRIASGRGLPRKQTLRSDDPRRRGLLADVLPPPTAELVQAHIERGHIPPH
ncbi:uncharacterized protein LOC120487527 isoform X2 [Pimephales promelas]|uniref:uncharacterized protein LOC120487527 isoform X2 n=1 Tax=Pimephales promelas TaxID=90988 RepID=UPI001955D2B1|nr:uncharacterized protein LOC120487527 isoform X2 [Pimephales promelas]